MRISNLAFTDARTHEKLITAPLAHAVVETCGVAWLTEIRWRWTTKKGAHMAARRASDR
jgi:hypothetical protein